MMQYSYFNFIELQLIESADPPTRQPAYWPIKYKSSCLYVHPAIQKVFDDMVSEATMLEF